VLAGIREISYSIDLQAELVSFLNFSFCRNLQRFSSLGGELKAGDHGNAGDVIRISYVAMVTSGKAEEVASEWCALPTVSPVSCVQIT